ncbi:MAG: spore maturation protein [Gammaproteobacteria bacterium RIFOXYA12_FULL_61_12]|nr:MAG: spore maturation protein [Gammaproteobacteria bacterium RIFOXYD12_FULL_61_37]OGT91234.1 MAG: spore maturation protein [Gammaproteobacteria bacterium RIFOXYA12_FULL_61_12]
MNIVFAFLIFTAFLVTAYRQLTWIASSPEAVPPMQALTTGLIDSAGSAVTLVLGMIGVMTFFLGLMKIIERGGLLVILARLIRPMMVRVFPEVPPDHPAMGAMIMNFSANMMGLGNAATPFGLRAMEELDKLNPSKGVATNAMVMFLAINTSSLALLPTGVVALRASLGSADPAAIIPTTLFATVCSTTVAIIAVLALQRFFPVRPLGDAPLPPRPVAAEPETELVAETGSYPVWGSLLFLGAILGMIPLTILYGKTMSPWVVPVLTVFFLGFGVLRRVPVYEAFIEGGREGFQLGMRIIPYLVAILTAVGMFRASGAMDYLTSLIGPLTSPLGLPAEALPMALMRPLSGSGAYAIMAGTLSAPGQGPDTYIGWLVSTLQGSSETTFYVLAVYFGAVGIKRARHAVPAALMADLAGVAAAVFICSWLYPA